MVRRPLAWTARAVVATALVCVAGACGGGTERVPDSVRADGVDTATLDPGKYPRVPWEPGLADDTTIYTYEAQRLADFVVPPWQVDPVLTARVDPTMPIRTPAEFEKAFGTSVTHLAPNRYVLYGFASTATEPGADQSRQRGLRQVVVRYADAARAQAAAEAIYTGYQHAGASPYQPTTLSGRPDVLALRGERDDGRSILLGMTTVGDMLLYSYVRYPAAEPEWGPTTVRTAIEKQTALIGGFPGRPTKAARGSTELPYPELDPHRILRYTIPVGRRDVAENGSGMFDATYGPIGASHFTGSPAQFHQAMLDAGIRYEADGDTTVWRAATDRQAGVFAEQMARLLSSAHGYIPDAAPTGLPVAHCFHKDTEDGRDFYCLLTVGRYVARTYAIDDQRDSWQRTAAQYLILTDADQKVTDR